jgi:hypothetical protein
MVIFHSYVSLPEGNHQQHVFLRTNVLWSSQASTIAPRMTCFHPLADSPSCHWKQGKCLWINDDKWISSPWYPWHRKEPKKKSRVKFMWCFCFALLSKLTSWLVLPLNKPGIDSRRPKYLSRKIRQVLMTLKTCSLIGTLSSFNIAMDYKWQIWPWLTFEKCCFFIHSYVSLPEDIQLMLMKIELILENH